MAVNSFCFLSLATSISFAFYSGFTSSGGVQAAQPQSLLGNSQTSPVAMVKDRSENIAPHVAQNLETTQIQSIILDNSRGQLQIRTNQPAIINSGWDLGTSAYRITVGAQLAPDVVVPETGANSLLLRFVIQTSGDNTILLLYPASGVKIGAGQTTSPELYVLPLAGGNTALFPPGTDPGTSPDISKVPSLPPVGTVNPRPVPPRPRVPATGTLVVIDPGHGGPDPGAVGIGGIQEKDIVLEVSYQVSQILQAQGLRVALTRVDDRDLGLEPRTSYANQIGANVFVSIHANAISLSRPEVNGVETFHFGDSSQPLAAAIQASMLEATGMNNRGVKQARFYVLRFTRMPSALVEIGFVTGAEDAPRLADPRFRATVSQAIARGILRYLGLSR